MNDAHEILATNSRRARAAAELRGVLAPGDLERRSVVGAHWRRRGTGRCICDLHRTFIEGVSLGMVQVEGTDMQH